MWSRGANPSATKSRGFPRSSNVTYPPSPPAGALGSALFGRASTSDPDSWPAPHDGHVCAFPTRGRLGVGHVGQRLERRLELLRGVGLIRLCLLDPRRQVFGLAEELLLLLALGRGDQLAEALLPGPQMFVRGD